MDSFYLEMRLTNDPDMSKHAEDYNLMVLEMVKGSQNRGITSTANNGSTNGFHSSIGTELLGADRDRQYNALADPKPNG